MQYARNISLGNQLNININKSESDYTHAVINKKCLTPSRIQLFVHNFENIEDI